MTELTAEQVAVVKKAVEADHPRYSFVTALATDRDRKLLVLTTFPDGEAHVATVSTGKAPNWLNNNDQFDEVVQSAVKKLARPGFS